MANIVIFFSSCDALFLSRVETFSLGGHSPAVPRLLKRAITNHKSKVLASRKQVSEFSSL